MHPHETLLAKHSIAVTDLPEKTQKKITKFAAETDTDKKEALDESIFGDVEDFVEAKADKEKAAAAKAEAAAKKKIDVSGAPTAAPAAAAGAADAPPPPKKEKTLMDHIYGRK